MYSIFKRIWLQYQKSNEVPKFEIDNIVRIPKYKNIFAKAYVLNWSEDFLLQNTKYCSVDLCYK